MNYSLHSGNRTNQQKGSILVVCMVMAAVGTLGVTAWISLMDARGHLVEANMLALERRTVRDNSKALAYEAIYQKHLHSNTPFGSYSEYAIDGDLGQCIIMPYATAPLTEATNTRQAKNGATPTRCFSTDVEVRLFEDLAAMKGSTFEPWNFQLRSAHPNLNGELLTFYPPTNFSDTDALVSGKLHVKGRAVFWDAVKNDFGAGLRANEYVLPNRIGGTTTFPNVGGTNILPLNYPIPMQSTGETGAGTEYSGVMDIFDSSSNSQNSYFHRMSAPVEIDASTAMAQGPGSATAADTANDALLETQIQNEDPSTLVNSLQPYYPLSSRVLNAVASKNNPSFTTAQIKQVYEAHTPIPNDALTHLVSTIVGGKLDSHMYGLHAINNTLYFSTGTGHVEVFLDQPSLPNLMIRSPQDLGLYGQQTTAEQNTAASLPPRTIIATRNPGDTGITHVVCRYHNLRRMVLGFSTQGTPAQTSWGEIIFEDSVFPTWCMLFESRGIPFNWGSSASDFTIRGGIRTDSKIAITSGQILTLEEETNYSGLEDQTTRTAWIEAYRN